MFFLNKRILLVEDDAVNAIVYASIMEEWGIAVSRACTGIEALHRIYNEAGFDLILMDINMPQMNGVEATIAVRKAGLSIPIIIVTGGSQDIDIVHALSAGANDYLIKPVSEVRLLHTFKKWINS